MKKWPFFAIILPWMASYGSERSFLLIFSARDDLVKVSWKSVAGKCPNQVTPPSLTSWVKGTSSFVLLIVFAFVVMYLYLFFIHLFICYILLYFVSIFASVFLIVEEIRECLHRRARSQWRRSKTTMDAIAAELWQWDQGNWSRKCIFSKI